MEALSITPLKLAHESLLKACAQPKDEFVRDSVIQRFEYTFELCWKTLKRYFKETQNRDIHHVKDIFREAANQDLLDDIEVWFGFQKARNFTSHTDNEKTAELVYQTALVFAQLSSRLLLALEKVLDD